MSDQSSYPPYADPQPTSYSTQPPPGYRAPQAGYGDPPPATPPRRRGRIWLVIGLVVATIAVIGLVIAAIVLVPVVREANAKLSTPQQVAGLTMDTSAKAQAALNAMKAEFTKDLHGRKTVAAIYRDADPTRPVIFVGVSGTFFSVKPQLDQAFAGLNSAGASLTGIADSDPGNLGGELRCGATKIQDAPASVCAWGDHGSIGLVLAINRTTAENAALTRQLRGAVETH